MRRPDFLWLCPLFSIALAAGVLIALGLSMWTVAAAALLLACPIAALWAYLSGRTLQGGVTGVPHTHGVTLNWLAPVYDRLCARMGLGPRFRDLTLGYLALREGERVLDVGCGTGVLMRLASDVVGPSGETVGIDPAWRMIDLARRNAGQAQSRAEFRLAAIEDLPCEDDHFDVVAASLMLHHLPPDLKRRGLREVRRVLKPAGRLLVTDVDRPRNRLWWLLAWPLLLMSTTGPNLRGQVPAYLREAGFADVHEVGGWGSLFTFWAAKKPAGAEREPATTHGSSVRTGLAVTVRP